MATLYISEFAHLGFDGSSSPVLAPTVPGLVEQTIPISGGSAAGVPFTGATRFIQINTDTACCLAFGVAPVALNTQHRMGANETRFYAVKAGDTIAVILGV